MQIGQYNKLVISRITEHGAYLCENNQNKKDEVLLPQKYLDSDMTVGKTVEVFVYTDSEDRPVATTERPFATVGQFAFLQTVQINKIGAFLDWGLQKNLLVPFKEQKMKMFPGGIYLVYVYLDHNSGRVVASAKIDKFLGNVYPEYKRGNKVKILIYGRTPIGYQVIVENRHKGMIYSNEIFTPVEIGEQIDAYVTSVRDDGKIDLTLTAPGTLGRIEIIGQRIIAKLENGEAVPNERSGAEEISRVLECSKKDYKKAVGMLYRERRIEIDENHNISLI